MDEPDPERSLKDEFMSIFEEENYILADLQATETQLEDMDPADTDGLQKVLDHMQDLQAKADAKDVYALESKAKKSCIWWVSRVKKVKVELECSVEDGK